MELVDIFNQDLFSTTSLTAAINKQPFVPGRLGAMGLFNESGVTTDSVIIEEKQGVLTLVQSVPRGSPANQQTGPKRTGRSVTIPHLPVEDTIQASEVQGVRQFGSTDQLAGVQSVVNGKIALASRNLDATLEWHRIGAVKGQVLDADASVLVDLFTTFGVAQPATLFFDLEAASPSKGAVRKLCHKVARDTEDELGAASYTGIVGICGSGFMDKLVSHPEVEKAYERWTANTTGGQPGDFLRARLARRSFIYADILFEEYRGKVGAQDFVDAESCHFFPVGVPDLFVTYFGPGDFMETVNTIGLPRYAKQAVDMRFQRFVDIHAQTNPLNLCTRPKVLIPGSSAAS